MWTWKTSLAFCSHLIPSTLLSVVAFDPAGASSGAFGIGTSSPPSFPGAGAGSSGPSVESGAKCDPEAVEVVPPYPPPPHAAHSSATAASTDAAQSHSRRVTSDVGRARADQLADCAVRDQHGVEACALELEHLVAVRDRDVGDRELPRGHVGQQRQNPLDPIVVALARLRRDQEDLRVEPLERILELVLVADVDDELELGRARRPRRRRGS